MIYVIAAIVAALTFGAAWWLRHTITRNWLSTLILVPVATFGGLAFMTYPDAWWGLGLCGGVLVAFTLDTNE